MILFIKTIGIFILCAACSCSGSQNKPKRPNNSKQSSESFIQMNKKLVGDEQRIIEQFVADNNLDMKPTETGLWYSITNEGTGDYVSKGRIVTINYTIRLLDNSLIYSSENDGTKEFLVGQGGVETGLEEGILLLKKGSKATFIMPPHLAHGLLGDDGKIPSRAILLYDVEVIDLKNRK